MGLSAASAAGLTKEELRSWGWRNFWKLFDLTLFEQWTLNDLKTSVLHSTKIWQQLWTMITPISSGCTLINWFFMNHSTCTSHQQGFWWASFRISYVFGKALLSLSSPFLPHKQPVPRLESWSDFAMLLRCKVLKGNWVKVAIVVSWEKNMKHTKNYHVRNLLLIYYSFSMGLCIWDYTLPFSNSVHGN